MHTPAYIKNLLDVPPNMRDGVMASARLYYELQTRLAHPNGRFDNAKRFYLTSRFECCVGIRPPSANFRFSQMQHGRTAEHVAHEAGLAEYVKAIRSLGAELKARQGHLPEDFLAQYLAERARAQMQASLTQLLR